MQENNNYQRQRKEKGQKGQKGQKRQKEKKNQQKRKYMKIKYFGMQKAQEYLESGRISKHILENPVRYDAIRGKNFVIPAEAFWVDKKHKKGPEIHVVCKDATILIFNANSKKLCTILFGRPGQVERYYKACNMEVPEYMMEWAMENQRTGKNLI